MKELVLLGSDRNGRERLLTARNGITAAKQKYNTHGIGEYWFSSESISNALSLSKTVDTRKVTIDASK